MDVSIIMINYNTYQLASEAIESIFEQTKNLQFEIILLDNASPDDSGKLLEQKFGSKITFIQLDDNLGTSKAFNVGVSNSSGKYVLWLNTDILLKENFIYSIFSFMEKNPDCGICGGNILDFNGKPTHSFRRKLPSLKTVKQGYSVTRKIINAIFKKLLSEEYNYTHVPLEVGYITGADMMVRRSVFDEIGGFDEDIFMYAEESEFTFRMKKNTRYKAIVVPYAHIFHLEGASFHSNKNICNEKRFQAVINGNYIYFKKCYGDKAAEAYVKILVRSYKKLRVISCMLLQRKKFKKYSDQLNVVLNFQRGLKNI